MTTHYFLNGHSDKDNFFISGKLSTCLFATTSSYSGNPSHNHLSIIQALRGLYAELPDTYSRTIPSSVFHQIVPHYHHLDYQLENLGIHNIDFCPHQRHIWLTRQLQYLYNRLRIDMPSFILSIDVPHAGYDYLIFLLARYLRIPFFALRPLGSSHSLLLRNSFSTLDRVPGPYNLEPTNLYQLLASVDPDYYMNWQHKLLNTTSPSQALLSITRSIRSRLSVLRHDGLYKSLDLLNTTTKVVCGSSSRSSPSQISYLISKTKSYHSISRLRKFYDAHSTVLPVKRPFVFFPLQTQPECSTAPLAGDFCNQLALLSHILSIVPPDILICIKEHPTQFLYSRHTSSMRSRDFYEYLLSFDRVRLVDRNISSHDCIVNSSAVFTTTGTAGFESIRNSIPVFFFGDPWYAGFPGAYDGNTIHSQHQFLSVLSDHREITSKLSNLLDYQLSLLCEDAVPCNPLETVSSSNWSLTSRHLLLTKCMMNL